MGVFRHISSNYKSLGITWDKVAEALDFVNDNDLAKDIRKKYCREVVGRFGYTVKPLYSGHPWDVANWLLFKGGLIIHQQGSPLWDIIRWLF